MVNSKITRLFAGLGLMYLVGCQEEPIIESLPLKLAIDNTNYTLVVNPHTHVQPTLLRDILSEQTNNPETDFMYDSINKNLRFTCIPDSTLNNVLNTMDQNHDNIIDDEELFYYYLTDPN